MFQIDKKNEILKDLSKAIDFTLISPFAKVSDIKKHCNIACRRNYYSVCLNPVNVAVAKEYVSKELLKDIKICAVVGYPLGENTTATKIFETKTAIADGADEIDVVISISRLKSGDFAYVKNELSRIVRVSRKRTVKAIIEVSALSKDEISKAIKICLKAKVDFIQTSTGFADGVATPEVVEFMASQCRGRCEIKAAGGILTKQDAINMIRCGASRIGTSRRII